ncbi:MAG: hypothetical protein ABIH46_00945 [Chloroflexota bacterium]
MIRDAVALERKGIPTVTLSHHTFVAASRAQAKVLGLPSLAIVPVPQPMPGEGPDDERKKAQNVLDELIKALTLPVAQESA